MRRFGWNLEKYNDNKLIITDGDSNVILRYDESTDFYVFDQVFIQEEYKSIYNFFRDNDLKINTMIDAGANIGLTSIYFKKKFRNAKIVCIEPEENNYKMLETNLREYLMDNSVVLYRAGLMGKNNIPLQIGTEFRGGGDWAKQTLVSKDSLTKLRSITISEIQKRQSIKRIDLLKIDIEGAETFLLEEETDISFLSETRCIAIEIHDEYNCREGINRLLKDHGFVLINIGETTLAMNKHFF